MHRTMIDDRPRRTSPGGRDSAVAACTFSVHALDPLLAITLNAPRPRLSTDLHVRG